MKFPLRYLPATLTKKDKQKQIKMLMKSKKLYRTKHQYYTRKPLASYKNKTSKHIIKARKIYNIKNLTPSKELARKTGCSLSALNQIEKLRAAVRELKKTGVDSIAVCLLFSFLHPQHEKRVREILSEECPEIFVCLSHEVCPEIREYERLSTTVLNAYVRPGVKAYLASLDEKLAQRGFGKHVHVMLSNGGISSTAIAQKIPIQLIESGPAAGALAAARELLQRLGALDAGLRITALGKRMLALGTHPRLAAMLLSAAPGDASFPICSQRMEMDAYRLHVRPR